MSGLCPIRTDCGKIASRDATPIVRGRKASRLTRVGGVAGSVAGGEAWKDSPSRVGYRGLEDVTARAVGPTGGSGWEKSSSILKDRTQFALILQKILVSVSGPNPLRPSCH